MPFLCLWSQCHGNYVILTLTDLLPPSLYEGVCDYMGPWKYPHVKASYSAILIPPCHLQAYHADIFGVLPTCPILAHTLAVEDRVISAHEMGQFTGMKYALWSHICDRIPTLNLVHSEPRALGCVSKPLSALVSPSLKWKRQLLNSETTTGSNEMKHAQ